MSAGRPITTGPATNHPALATRITTTTPATAGTRSIMVAYSSTACGLPARTTIAGGVVAPCSGTAAGGTPGPAGTGRAGTGITLPAGAGIMGIGTAPGAPPIGARGPARAWANAFAGT